jgi:hypothetical protein
MSGIFRNSVLMALLALSSNLLAQNPEGQLRQAPLFSVFMAIFTIIVLFLGIIIQKRWRD